MKLDDAFLEEVQRKGLVLESPPWDKKDMWFFLNYRRGFYILNPTADKVMKVIHIARKYSESDSNGLHNILLRFVGLREDLNKRNSVGWYTKGIAQGGGTISLRLWLKSNGQWPDAVYIERNPINWAYNFVMSRW